jgi:shikimate kinase
MTKPIALLGLPGCGKTYWGKKLAKELEIQHYDLDELIARQSGLSIPQIFHEGGEALFRSIESSTLFELCHNQKKEKFVLSLGGGTPAFNSNMALVNQHFITIYLNVSISAVIKQLREDKTSHRPLVKKSKPEELKDYMCSLFNERQTAYLQADYLLKEDEITLNNFKKILKDAQ